MFLFVISANIKWSVSHVLLQDMTKIIHNGWPSFRLDIFLWQIFTVWSPLFSLQNSVTGSCEPIKKVGVIHCKVWLAESSNATYIVKSSLGCQPSKSAVLVNFAIGTNHFNIRKFDIKMECKCDEKYVNIRRKVWLFETGKILPTQSPLFFYKIWVCWTALSPDCIQSIFCAGQSSQSELISMLYIVITLYSVPPRSNLVVKLQTQQCSSRYNSQAEISKYDITQDVLPLYIEAAFCMLGICPDNCEIVHTKLLCCVFFVVVYYIFVDLCEVFICISNIASLMQGHLYDYSKDHWKIWVILTRTRPQ